MSSISAAAPPVGDFPATEPYRPARLWPAATLVAVYWTIYFGLGLAEITNFHKFVGRMYALAVLVLLFFIWWLCSRRLPIIDRLIVFAGAVVFMVASVLLLHGSFDKIQLAVAFYAMPAMLTAWTAWLFVTRTTPRRTVRNGMLVLAALAWGWTLALRTDGLSGEAAPAFHWRWTPTGEQQFLAERVSHKKNSKSAPRPASEPLVAAGADWPGFRGLHRDGAVRGLKIATNWKKSPPKLVWKRRVGPGWSSIVVIGARLFTQEQREDSEAVVCYSADTGDEIWSHQDAGRFSEAMGGDGPRATPTFSDGLLYALGANGVLNCLDASDGKVKWSHDISKTGQSAGGDSKVPVWGYASSPLVVDGKVIVFAGGGGGSYSAPKDKESEGKPVQDAKGNAEGEKSEGDKNTLLAFDAQTGDIVWRAPAGDHSYSSPQLAKFAGQQQILFAGDRALEAFDPATGKTLWSLATNAKESMPSIQPHLLDGEWLLVSFNGDAGIVRAAVSHDGDKWKVNDESQSKWTGRDMKPFFNDFVRAGDSLYGFDGNIFCSIDANTGKRNWKKGRYGAGQVILIADQSVLLVVTESGDIVLVDANPEKHEELGRISAIHGKTWNHPAIANGRLFVRNAEEMACYELTPME